MSKYKHDVERLARTRSETKDKAIFYMGGKCTRCLKVVIKSAFEFHHTDPKGKDFNISSSNRKFESIKPELDKCILVCSNCHKKIHKEIYIPKQKEESLIKQQNNVPGYQSSRGAKRRLELLNMFGCKCLKCNETEPVCLEFRHFGSDKSFNVDTRACAGYKMDKLIAEAKKCIIICSNCARE